MPEKTELVKQQKSSENFEKTELVKKQTSSENFVVSENFL